jgi:uncharacterized coiled-coil protein SlyX
MEQEKSIQEIIRLLTGIDEKLQKISETQNALLENFSKSDLETSKRPMPVDVNTLLKLPDHLRMSLQKLMALKSATAEEVAAETGRTRAAESDYLNQLLKMGYLKKERRGRTVFFSVE